MPQPNVLIIDDEPLMRISIADALKAEGCQVKVATTGLEGMDLIRKEPFEIVITDLRLPGMDGLQILQACKEVSPTTGVIVITAYAPSRRRWKPSKWARTTTSPSPSPWTSCC